MITLKWDSPLTNCDLMFSGLSNIIEIDLSYFNPSYAESMKYMFHNCFNLTKINFGNNFNTKSNKSFLIFILWLPIINIFKFN